MDFELGFKKKQRPHRASTAGTSVSVEDAVPPERRNQTPNGHRTPFGNKERLSRGGVVENRRGGGCVLRRLRRLHQTIDHNRIAVNQAASPFCKVARGSRRSVSVVRSHPEHVGHPFAESPLAVKPLLVVSAPAVKEPRHGEGRHIAHKSWHCRFAFGRGASFLFRTGSVAHRCHRGKSERGVGIIEL
jgi:hypothetical protein